MILEHLTKHSVAHLDCRYGPPVPIEELDLRKSACLLCSS